MLFNFFARAVAVDTDFFFCDFCAMKVKSREENVFFFTQDFVLYAMRVMEHAFIHNLISSIFLLRGVEFCLC